VESSVTPRYNFRMAQAEIPREEVSLAVETRREVGEDLEPHVIDAFLERVGAAIDERVDQRIAGRRRSGGPAAMGLAVISLVFAIPLTGIGGGTAGLAGLLVVWAGIVAVNFAYALRRR
jgi:hypothetical protein